MNNVIEMTPEIWDDGIKEAKKHWLSPEDKVTNTYNLEIIKDELPSCPSDATCDFVNKVFDNPFEPRIIGIQKIIDNIEFQIHPQLKCIELLKIELEALNQQSKEYYGNY